MNFKKQIFRFVISSVFIFTGCINPCQAIWTGIYADNSMSRVKVSLIETKSVGTSTKEVAELNEALKTSLTKAISGTDTMQCRYLVEKINRKIIANDINGSVLSESYYLIGIFHLIKSDFNESIRYFNLCISYKVKESEYDERYAKALYNLGLVYLNLGDSKRHEEYSLKSLEIEKKLNGNSNILLFNTYLSLSSAYIELKEYDKGINYINNAIAFANSKPDSISPLTVADLYSNLGGCYVRLADYSKAKVYLDKAESMYNKFNFRVTENYINLMNNLVLTCVGLKLTAEAGVYYDRVIPVAIANNSSLAYNIINSYAVFLADNGRLSQGEKLLRDALERAKSGFKTSERNYFEVLINYANYLRDYKINNSKALECYEKCFQYLKRNEQDLYLKRSVLIGYSLSLDEAGELDKALKTIQLLLNSDQENDHQDKENFINPVIEKIKPDKTSLQILNSKYRILWDIYKKTGDRNTLEAASNTSELIVSLLEKIRINISEDDSRLILGDKYRNAYLNSIRDFNLLYNKTKDSRYLEKAFEYSEKSKVEGLLTSTRELKATQLNIPSGIGDVEKKLQGEINQLNAQLADENAREKPNSVLINNWKENLLEATRSNDSLILIFEKQFPVYYAIKYNTHVAELKDIPKIIGSEGNYINYVLSDTVLYIFIANKKFQQLHAIHVDSSFFSDIRKFRRLLSMPLPSDNASVKFREFQEVGYRLYKTLIEPVKPAIISEKLFISPDNILSYLPFETIPVSSDPRSGNMYKDLNYLMESYDISYTYSATFMSESMKKQKTLFIK